MTSQFAQAPSQADILKETGMPATPLKTIPQSPD